MIIDELMKQKMTRIEELEEEFPNDVVSLEMFRKKYEGNYYSSYYITSREPFVSRIHLSKKYLEDTPSNDIKDFPKIDGTTYQEIENFPDYDYLNSIAYEMLIRTKEYKGLLTNMSDDNSGDMIKKLDQLGLEIKDIYDYKKISKSYGLEKENDTFSNSYLNMTINDIEQGLDRLIKFYISKEQVYTIDSVEKVVFDSTEIITGRIFKVVSDIAFDSIRTLLSNYYIPAKFAYQVPANNEKLINIDKNIPLVALNEDFLQTIEELIPNRIKGSIDFNFTRPLLRFKELPIVDVPINLNLSRKELTQLILKLKDDFEDGTVENPINYLYNRKYRIEDMKNFVPFHMTKKSIAEAFYIYDLYKYVHSEMLLQKQKLSKFKQLDIEKIENDIKSKKEKKEKEINEIIEKLEVNYKDKKY